MAKPITFRSSFAASSGTITKPTRDYECFDVSAARLLVVAIEGWIIFAEQHPEQGLVDQIPCVDDCEALLSPP